MLIQAFCSGPLDTNAYIVACEKTKQCLLIDAPFESFKKITSFLEKNGLSLEVIYLTHSHLDHIADIATFLKGYPGCGLWVHQEDAQNVIDPGSDGIPLFFPIDPATPTGILEEGQAHKVGDLEFTIIHTPGHSPGSVCFHFLQEGVLFSGDTLFKRSIGTLSLPTSEPERMWPSLEKLGMLPSATQIYPGHGNSTTIAQEPWIKNAQEIFG